MCRYAMVKYKPHYACFHCRKTFKRRLLIDIGRHDKLESKEARCPSCGQLMASMGLDFKAPKKDNIEEWEHINRLYSVGIIFHSCGCSGPGYIPNTKETLIAYFEEIKQEYQRQLEFWRQRAEPENQSEIDRDISKNGYFIGRIPLQFRASKRTVVNQEAKNYWIERLIEIDQKICQAKNS
ncbi:hypothetical protein [Dinghuibacter silviterrae]|uniref:Uncharacterized protein n=1 Tax=Dinghuibacter silviterrae TaxID=1539049 RepID=A0A4R8DTD4_9BACT|nr:hypothetical protein [Dinghuibacter silviterrae]TDX01544.1 hypothetical protein EDB95_2584 [Dinghuibacter silviterrae]